MLCSKRAERLMTSLTRKLLLLRRDYRKTLPIQQHILRQGLRISPSPLNKTKWKRKHPINKPRWLKNWKADLQAPFIRRCFSIRVILSIGRSILRSTMSLSWVFNISRMPIHSTYIWMIEAKKTINLLTP